MNLKTKKIQFKKIPDGVSDDHIQRDFYEKNPVAVPVKIRNKTFFLNYQGGYNTDSYLFESYDSYWILSMDSDDFHSVEQFLKASLDHTIVNKNTGEIYIQGSQLKEDMLGNLKSPINITKRMASFVENFS